MTFEWDVIQTGLLNTVLGMGTVFVVLIFIIFLISAFSIIPKLQEKFSNKTDNSEAKAEPLPYVPVKAEPTDTAVSVTEPIEEMLTDDMELVAVITAAIAASMGDEAPADGFVVRSIKRANTKKWQNA